MRWRRDRADLKLPAGACVVGSHAVEQQDQERYGDDDHPGTLHELGDEEDGCCGGGDHGSESVYGGPPGPAGFSGPAPMYDETGLGQREADEHADGEQWDERVRVTADGDEQQAREDGQHTDPVAEHEPAVPYAEQVGKVMVPCQQARQHGQPTEGGVGGKSQDEGDRERHDVVGPVSPHGIGHDLARTV